MKLIIISNRAPVSVYKENGNLMYVESSGGLASGLRSYIENIEKTSGRKADTLWVGWPGATVNPDETARVKKEMRERFGTQSVFIPEKTMENFYEGFCNKTLWPLFHYFPSLAVYDSEYWKQYVSVNESFCNAVMEVAEPGDIFWIHDYHLMLLPSMIRERMRSASIGFFLHIPFPSYEVFRLLPNHWRKKILTGLLGSDLIGFHTHDYRTYFLRSVLRVLGIADDAGELFFNNRLVKTDSFPMGIDYWKFRNAALSNNKSGQKSGSPKTILSIDRQDYSKGILKRLHGYERFLRDYLQWKGKVVMMMIVVPSRIGVESYQDTKSQIDEQVGYINGIFGNFDWQPINYQYRSLSFSELIAAYQNSDVALVTPLRDGMNLIAKEYIASRTSGTGALILSEMAGAAEELSEAVIINPNNMEEISSALHFSLEMSAAEQKIRMDAMQKRLEEYDLLKWADDFLTTMENAKARQHRLSAKMLTAEIRKKMSKEFEEANSALLFLDYDGTLREFTGHPYDAVPKRSLLNLIESLSGKPGVQVVIISGRDRKMLDKWFGHLPLSFAAEHGLFIKEKGKQWQQIKPLTGNWKPALKQIMQQYSRKLPGSFVEEKEFSLVFHYRKSEYHLAQFRVAELVSRLLNITANMDVNVLHGSKVVELRNSGVDKGVAAMHWLAQPELKSRFILAVGDDWTDEDLFRVMPPNAYSVKVGTGLSNALYNVNAPSNVLALLEELNEAKGVKKNPDSNPANPSYSAHPAC